MRGLLEIQALTIELVSGRVRRKLVNRVDLVLRPARPLCLIGETGCGKTLIAQAMLGLLPAEMSVTGMIRYRGENLLDLKPKQMRRLWGGDLFLFPQEPGRYLNPLRRSRHQVAEVFRWVWGRNGAQSRALGRALLGRVGLSPKEDGRKYPWQLSGGMNQRLLAGITLAEPARLVVADEPTKGLDTKKGRARDGPR